MSGAVFENERDRLAALHACAIIDTPREPTFDNIVFTAAQIFRVPMAMLSLIDEARVWVKAGVGPLPPSWDREQIVSRLITGSGDLLIIEDASAEARFSRPNTTLAEAHIRFCASAPLHGPGRHVIGALSVMDRHPRTVPERQRYQLMQLAREAEELLCLRVPDTGPLDGQSDIVSP